MKNEYDRRLGYAHFKAGSWVVRLALLPHSPPTWIDSRFVIEDPRARGQHPPPLSPSSFSSPSSPFAGPPTSLLQAIMAGDPDTASPSNEGARAKPRVELRLKAREQLTSAKWDTNSQVVMALEESALANSLQFKCVLVRSSPIPV